MGINICSLLFCLIFNYLEHMMGYFCFAIFVYFVLLTRSQECHFLTFRQNYCPNVCAVPVEILWSNFLYFEMDLQCGNGRKHGHLPFFPKYEFELLFKDKLRVTWFEPNFSQSQYCNKSKSCGSNACTLIVVLLTMKCHLDNIQVIVHWSTLRKSVIAVFTDVRFR